MKVNSVNKPTTDPQSTQTFSLSSAKFREALLQLSCNTWEGKSHSWGWMDERASGLSSRCAESREKILALLDT